MPKRDELLFYYTGAEISQAAGKMATYHAERSAWWQEEKAKAEEGVRGSLEVRESPVTGGFNLTPTVDTQKAQRLQECRTKVDVHLRASSLYEAWARVMATPTNGVRVYDLTIQDVQYFNLVDMDPVLVYG